MVNYLITYLEVDTWHSVIQNLCPNALRSYHFPVVCRTLPHIRQLLRRYRKSVGYCSGLLKAPTIHLTSSHTLEHFSPPNCKVPRPFYLYQPFVNVVLTSIWGVHAPADIFRCKTICFSTYLLAGIPNAELISLLDGGGKHWDHDWSFGPNCFASSSHFALQELDFLLNMLLR